MLTVAETLPAISIALAVTVIAPFIQVLMSVPNRSTSTLRMVAVGLGVDPLLPRAKMTPSFAPAPLQPPTGATAEVTDEKPLPICRPIASI